MKRNIRFRLSLTLILVLLIGYFGWQHFRPLNAEGTLVKSARLDDGTNVKFRTQGDKIELYDGQGWQSFFAKGVNIGATVPGHDPGELSIDKQTFLRWFAQIQELGANVIRIYTIHEPVFYEALVEFNEAHPDSPLYFIQGVWSPESQMIKTHDALSPLVTKAFKKEIIYAVGAVYGDANIPKEAGKAHGRYKTNAGPYLLGWSIGTEWDPALVEATDRAHQGMEPFQGNHFKATVGATPFENMLAEMLDTLAAFETRQGWQHPYAFTNWVSTDPLEHPGEIDRAEDWVSVDPMHVEPVNWQAGYFASFHAYPYYPEFFRSDETIRNVINDKGEIDTYKAYLRLLKEHHKDVPILVTEFGVPASLGIGHITGLGRNQGGHTEEEQGVIDADLLHEIAQENYAGAILFMWQDEWFKRTWNTQDFEQPVDRRKYWLNVLTNEKLFGLVGMYSSKDGPLLIDGKLDDWEKIKDKKKYDSGVPGWNAMWVTHDEAYVYIAAELDSEFDPEKQMMYIGADTMEGGNRHAMELGDRTLGEGLETLVAIGKTLDSEVRIASNYDFTTRLWGTVNGMAPVEEEEMKDDSGVFKPWRLIVDMEFSPPAAKYYRPYKDVPAGQLRRGTTDPSSPDYNSLTMWQAQGNVVEMRIPWMLLGFADPSSLRAVNYLEKDGKLQNQKVDGIRLVPWIVDRATNQVIGLGDGSDPVELSKMPKYKWKPWNSVQYQERLKKSYSIMQKAFHNIGNGNPPK
ncbi:MAG: hypothetical protein K0Q59_4376 [Paenibacillus sp.]|nr:hypothetical protein [Paenibacillus sp.]